MIADLVLLCREVVETGIVDTNKYLYYVFDCSPEARVEINFRIACSYFYQRGEVKKALVYAQRAFAACHINDQVFRVNVEILDRIQNFDQKRKLYKEIGRRYALQGMFEEALFHFDLSRDVYANAGLGDLFFYDRELLLELTSIKSKLQPLPRLPFKKCFRRLKGKRGLAYLVFGVSHINSVIVKILCDYAKWHDRDVYDVCFFVPEPEFSNTTVEHENIQRLRVAGADVFQPKTGSVLQALLETASAINSFAPDVFITTAILAKYSHYLLSLLVAGCSRVGYCYGPPEQYIVPELDFVMCPAAHPVVGISNNVFRVPLEFDFSSISNITVIARETIGIPSKAVVLVAAGRPSKFLDQSFWEALVKVLDGNDNSYFLLIGLSVKPDFIMQVIPDHLVDRIKTFGWLDNYLSVLGIADVVVDTFPSGGGVVLAEAMAMDIPVVTFEEDYESEYSQMNWNPGSEIVPEDSLILPRFNMISLEETLSKLIKNESLRHSLGRSCGKFIRAERGNVERSVRRVESFFEERLFRK